jgi:glycosyltransferase involved in cell wall biosynthesis
VPKRILIVSNFFPPKTIGGAEIVALRQAHALSVRDHKVVVLAGTEPTSEAPPGMLNFDVYEGLPVYRLSLRSLDPNLNFYWPSAARRLRALIDANGIEAVHFHNVMGLGANLIPAAKAARAYCVVTLHDHWGFCFRATRLRSNDALCNNFEECAGCRSAIQLQSGLNLPMRLRRDYVRWCLDQADQLLTPSTYLTDTYVRAGVEPSKISVLSNGIDLDAVPDHPKEPSSNGVVTFLWSGYLGEHKGIEVLLKALRLLVEDQNLSARWQTMIAGDGHLRAAVEAKLDAYKLRAHVRSVGRLPRNELLELLRRSDVSVLTSIWPENEPVTMLEAIASGTAQIATRIGGSVELVEDGRTGFLITAGDPVELADAMRRYIMNPSLAEEHGARNRERRNNFDERKTIEALESILSTAPNVGSRKSSPEPVIICGTAWPPMEVASLLGRAHEYLPAVPTARFIWYEWADTAVWNSTALIWLWDRHAAQELVSTGLRRGVPVLAPATEWAQGLARHFGSVILYNTYLEALAAMRALLSVPALLSEFSSRALPAAAVATALAPEVAFSLHSEKLLT